MLLSSVLILVASSLVVTTCSLPRSALIGTWRAELTMGSNVLVLDGNGTFRQQVSIRDLNGRDRTVTRLGTWEYDGNRLFGQVLLRNCLAPTDMDDQLNPRFEQDHGNCSYAVERDWGLSSRLRIGSIEGTLFYKVKEPTDR